MVAQIRIGYAFTLVLCSQVSPLRTGTPFSYGPAGETRRFVPSAAPGPAPLPCLHQATVTSAETGRLTMAFADGGERYEAFTVTGFLPAARRGFSFTALTRGGLSRS
jgi:hypothetical protein